MAMFAASSPAHAQAPSEVDFSQVPGVVIMHSAASTHRFIGSPGLAVLPNGHYLAKCDLFGPGVDDEKIGTTPVFESADRGRTWTHLTDVRGMYWASVFVHRGAVYLLGTNRDYGDLVIMRSTDGGRTWAAGMLRRGKFHCAPVPIVEHAGRLWRGTEDAEGPGGWGSHFRAFMLSAPVGADLLKADSWTRSAPLTRDATWNNGDFGGWLEGNAVVAPDGSIVDVLRIAVQKPDAKAAIVHISTDGKTATFNPQSDIVNFPGGATKFTIRFDARTKLYWSLANYVPPAQRHSDPGAIRNTLALISSSDLRQWTVRSIVLRHPDQIKHGFQYVDWQFEADDLIAVSRTAYDDGLGGADNYHNANFLTFHRFAHFRALPK